MKKRLLSMLMALVLCLTLLPTAALADELGPVDGTSTVETAGADAEAEAKAKAGAEAVAAVQAMIDALPEEITADDADIADALAAIEGEMAALSEDQRAALDVSRYEATLAALEGQADEAEQDADESENADAGDTEQGTASDDNYTPSESGGTAEVDKLPSPVQAMIDALPDALTEENAGDVSAMLGKIDAAMAALGDEERAALDLTQYQAVIAALAALDAAQGEIALYADENNKPKGEGTEESPYQITSNKELEWFRDTVNAGETGICAELMNNLNFKDETGWTWTPIGNGADKAYTGTFNGNGYKISMKYAVAPDGMTAGWGLFGSIGKGGRVQDLEINLSNFGRNGNAFSISESGMLAAYNSGTIERCTATSGKINVSNGVGLLVYQNDGTIQDCWTKLGTVYGGGNLIGGVAYINNGNIKNCFFNGGYQKPDLNNHTITFEKGSSGSIANCYFILDRHYTDDTKGVTGVAQADANSGKLTVKLNNDGNERGSEVDPWRFDSVNKCPSLKKTDRRVSYDSKTDGYEKGDPPHMHGNVEFTKVTALSDIKADGNYYISGEIALNSTWEVDKKILLCLDGQTITAASGVAPAIKISSSGSLTLVDGSKTGGGKITGGATGVMLNGGAFTMQGGEISGNTVGVDVQSGSLTLGGKAQITGNDKNILLAQGSKISFDSLDPSAKFGISVENQKDLSDPVAVTDATGGQYFGQLVADGFKDNGVGFELYLSDDGKTVMLGKQSAHTHCICGGRNTNLGHTSHSDVTFQPWRETDKLPTSGNYYLTRNVTLTKNATLQNANVCLNGYTVTLSNVGRINPSGTTQLTDCSVNGKLESYPGKANGGVTISGGSKFYLYGGTLNGVKVEIGQTGGGTFNMYGGKITGNTQGTVVGQSKTSNKSTITINMYGGEISGNNISENQGGGVFVGSGNQFNMYGGTIQNNSAVDGGGVYVAPAENAYSAGTMTICGDAVIQGNNKAGGVTNNVSLPKGSTIKIDGQMNESAQIGVTTRASLSAGNVDIATATGAGWVAAKNFTSDKFAYHVGLVNDGKTVQLQVHSHQWEYSVSPDGTTITAKCTAEHCDLADSNGGSVKLVPPSGSLIYDGAEKTAKLEKPTWKGDTVAEAGIKYTKDVDNTFTGNPKDAGTYTASITVGEGENAATASVKYTIAKAAPTASDFTFQAPAPSDLTYNGNPKTATVASTKNGMGAVTVKYFKNGAETEPKDAGDYTVKVSVAEGANYNATTDDLTTDDWKFTIGKATQTITVPTDKTIVKGGIAEDISDWATVAGVTGGSNPGTLSYALDGQALEGVSLTGNQLTVQPTCTAAQFTIKVTAEETGNYNKEEQTFTVKVADKNTATVTITGLPDTVTYGQEFTLTASQTGDTTSANKKWTWDYVQEYFKLVGPNANTETITLQAIKAGTPSKGITATYESGTHKGSKTVTPGVAQKEVTVSGITAADKVYDGNNSAMVNVSTATITGKETGDDLTVSVAAGSTFDSADAGSRTVTLGTLTLGGTSAGNYTLATSGNQTTATANITVRDLTVKPDSGQSKSYGTTPDPVLAYTSTGTVTGETAAFDGALSREAGEDVGQYDITKGSLELKDSGTFKAANYNLVLYTAVVTFEITKGTYGSSAPTKTVNILKNYAGVQTGTLTAADFFTTAPAEAKITNAVPNSKPSSMMSLVSADSSGNFTYDSKTNITAASDESWTVTISSKNYTDINATLTFKLVDKTDAGVTISSVPASKTYGESFTLTASVTDAGTGTGNWTWTSNDPSVLQVTGTGASATVKALKAGSATISAKYESDTTMGEQTTAPITVDKRVITVTADNKSMTVNGTLPTFTVTYGNLPSGVQAADIFGTLASASTTTDGKTTGSFDITVTTPVLKTEAGANYEVGAVTKGTLTVNPRSSSGGGGGSSVSTYSVTVGKTENGSVSVSPKSASKGDTVTVTVTPDKGYTLETLTVLDKNGKELKLTEKNGKYTFTMPAGKVEVKVTFMDDNTMLNYFVDVKAGDYFYDAVKWAAEKGITSGTDATHFGPNAACTRAQIVTFLWRTAGSPEPKGTGSFADVPTDSYYAKAVAWAVENGITGGTGDGKFSPNATCTREQAVAFLYRASGSPAVSGGSAFNDVAANAYYADAVAWAEKNEITGGIGGGLFGSGNDCTRAQIVTFLYRTYQGK